MTTSLSSSDTLLHEFLCPSSDSVLGILSLQLLAQLAYSHMVTYLYLGTWNLMIHCRHYADTSATSYTTGGPASCCITQQTLFCCAWSTKVLPHSDVLSDSKVVHACHRLSLLTVPVAWVCGRFTLLVIKLWGLLLFTAKGWFIDYLVILYQLQSFLSIKWNVRMIMNGEMGKMGEDK